jgi:4'-phosphopantetheinyl transferase
MVDWTTGTGNQMTKLYVFSIDPIMKKETIAPFLPLFADEEQKRIMRFRDIMDSYRCLVGRLLLLHSFKDFNIARCDLRDLQYTPHKRPVLQNIDNFSFSISHSGSLVAIVLSNDQELGIDIEEIKPRDLSDCDQYISVIDASRRWELNRTLPHFYDIWTQNEAILKAQGTGFLTTLAVTVSEDQAWMEGRHWYLKAVDLGPTFRGHIASSRKEYALDVIRVHVDDLGVFQK